MDPRVALELLTDTEKTETLLKRITCLKRDIGALDKKQEILPHDIAEIVKLIGIIFGACYSSCYRVKKALEIITGAEKCLMAIQGQKIDVEDAHHSLTVIDMKAGRKK